MGDANWKEEVEEGGGKLSSLCEFIYFQQLLDDYADFESLDN